MKLNVVLPVAQQATCNHLVQVTGAEITFKGQSYSSNTSNVSCRRAKYADFE